MNDIDLTKILKDCPKGTKLYSTIYGEVTFSYINNFSIFPIIIRVNDDFHPVLTKDGRHSATYKGECTLFPSKDQRDWSKFTAPWYKKEKLVEPKFHVGQYITDGYVGGQITSIEDNYHCYKILDFMGGTNTTIPFTLQDNYHLWTINDANDGDVLATSKGVFIYNNTSILQAYCYYSNERNRFIIEDRGHHCPWNMQEVTPATKEQRDTLMKAMNDAGYEWDAEKKELKKLVVFGCKAPNRFDPKTLKPFDKVLVRDGGFPWRCDIFSYYQRNKRITCHCTSDDYIYDRCIPYNEETKHLVGTNNKAPEFYRYWEE